jgi:hypothetical protein
MPVALGAAPRLQELLASRRIYECDVPEIEHDRQRPAVLDLGEFLPQDQSG